MQNECVFLQKWGKKREPLGFAALLWDMGIEIIF